MSDLIDLIPLTASVYQAVKRFLRGVSEAPDTIKQIHSQMLIWEAHLDHLQELRSSSAAFNAPAERFLRESGVLSRAQDCLEALYEIVDGETRHDLETRGEIGLRDRASAFIDHAHFHLRGQKRAEECTQQLAKVTRDLQTAMQMNLTEKVGALHEEVVTSRERQLVLSWLEPRFEPRGTDPGSIHLERTKLQEPGTCEWLLKHQFWEDWFNGGSPFPGGGRRFLWLNGHPGSGKTVLVSFANDKIIESCGAYGSSYYYCFNEHNRDETESFLRHVVRDFCFQLRWVPTELLTMWRHKKMNNKRLLECLLSVTKRFGKRVYIVVDAVDESKIPRMEFLETLTTIGTDTTFQHVSLLMASRNEPDIQGFISRLAPALLPSKSGLPLKLPVRVSSGPPEQPRPVTSWQPAHDSASLSSLPDPGYREYNRHCNQTEAGSETRSPQSWSQQSTASGVRIKREAISILMEHDSGPDGSGVSSQQNIAPLFRSRSALGTRRARNPKMEPPCLPPPDVASSWDQRTSIGEDAVSDGAATIPGLYSTRRDVSPKRQLCDSHQTVSRSSQRIRVSSGGRHVEVDQGDIKIINQGVAPCSELSMSNQDVRLAIEAVIDQRLRNSDRFGQWPREDFIGKLKKKLAYKAGGIFRAISCYLDLIDRQGLLDEEKILVAIEQMPDTIFRQYEKILITGLPDLALALVCSSTAEIPDATVLVEASRYSVPQGRAKAYNLKMLKNLLGCLVTEERLKKTERNSKFGKDRGETVHPGDSVRLVLAHYTVREFLFNKSTALSEAQYFALSRESIQQLELKIVFYGLQQCLPERRFPTRYEEYCLDMTERAINKRTPVIAKDKDIWQALILCLGPDDPHQQLAGRTAKVRTFFPTWNKLSLSNVYGSPASPPEHRSTCIVVSTMLLDWSKLANAYLKTLNDRQRDEIWLDRFELSKQLAKDLGSATSVLEMCVSGRRLDFMEVFIDNGATFEDAGDIVMRIFDDPYADGDQNDDGTATGRLLTMMLERGAELNAKGHKWTALQIATRSLEPIWVDKLLYHGANPNDVGDPQGKGAPDPNDDEDVSGVGDDLAWYRKTPLRICREAKPSWDENLEWSRNRVEQLLTAALRRSQPDAAMQHDTRQEEPIKPSEDI